MFSYLFSKTCLWPWPWTYNHFNLSHWGKSGVFVFHFAAILPWLTWTLTRTEQPLIRPCFVGVQPVLGGFNYRTDWLTSSLRTTLIWWTAHSWINDCNLPSPQSRTATPKHKIYCRCASHPLWGSFPEKLSFLCTNDVCYICYQTNHSLSFTHLSIAHYSKKPVFCFHWCSHAFHNFTVYFRSYLKILW